jgi:hypothetical protein
MIIFRVLSGRSWRNARESEELTERVLTAIQFARSGAASTIDIEAEGTEPAVVEIEDPKVLPLSMRREATNQQDAVDTL